LLFRSNLVDQSEQGLLDELDQALEHLRFAGEMAVERRLRHADAGCQGRSGDLLAPRILQHLRQGLQNLQFPLAGFGCHGSSLSSLIVLDAILNQNCA
jgi:hypothetical protein